MSESSSNKPGEMIRTPRTSFNGRLAQIQAHNPYMNQGTLEEEDGVLVNDEVDDYFSPDETYSGEEFELDSNDGLNDYCYSSEEETDDKHFQYIDVGNGIRVKTTDELKEALEHFKTTVWSTADRNENLKPPSYHRNDKFATNIYKFSTTSATKAVQNITNADEKKYTKKKQCSFSLVHKHHGKVSFQVPVDESKFPVKDKDINTYWAWVERGTDNWIAIPASLRNGYVEFSCDRMTSFGIICGPTVMTNIVHPLGTTISTSKDGRLVLQFDKGSVDKEQTVKYSIQRPDQEYAKQSLNSKTLVASVSDKIRLNYEKSQFKKPIHLFGTLSCNEENGSDFEEFDVKIVGYQDDKPSILDTITEKVTAGRFTGKLDGYDGGALVAIKRGQKENENLAETLKNELDLFYGNRKVCKVLLFYTSKDNTTLYFKAECCMQGNLVDIIAKNKEHKLVFKSLDILLPPHQRIRIRPTGCLGLKPDIKNHPFLFFMYVTKENNTLFSVELNRGMGRSTNAIIEFSADNQRRGEITKADFSLDFLSSGNQRPGLSRANSTMSDIFRPQPRSSTDMRGLKNNV
ncbi:Hypothetical predicted protein [Mytilus galloprovincialis]|uniref:Uncharacterized protein n=1 Tax=Mytilus galloprovincialis TaxID=29158 RepID=A0A8B6CJN1_MYTGA|nr:Hypothetical predicted protein [Mytilus galloprovincialis]